MAKYSFRCPACREKFPFEPADGLPSSCPACGYTVASDRPDDDIVIPWVRTHARTAVVDKVYRDMERGSELRAQAAADMLGVPVSEMSALKITNLNDRQKPGDIAAPTVNNSITQAMAAHPNLSQANLSRMGLEFSRTVGQGFAPNMGARMLTAMRAGHQDKVLEHCTGVDAYTKQVVRPSIDVLSENPSHEVMQPGYRRRG